MEEDFRILEHKPSWVDALRKFFDHANEHTKRIAIMEARRRCLAAHCVPLRWHAMPYMR